MIFAFGCDADSQDNDNWYYVSNNALFVNLEGNATTGYQWKCFLSDTTLKCEMDEYVPDKVDQNVCGAGGIQKYKFTPTSNGQCTITFKYQRSWEDSPIQTKKLLVTIENGKIATVEE